MVDAMNLASGRIPTPNPYSSFSRRIFVQSRVPAWIPERYKPEHRNPTLAKQP